MQAQVGIQSHFAVVARDVFGDAAECKPERFSVQIVPLTPAFDEDG